MRLVRGGSSWSGRERNCCFLNCGTTAEDQLPVFSNVSAVSALDFLDDGRAVAVCDWDGDGDLDLWLRNRNAPRLRLMLNRTQQLDPSMRHLTLSLRGTTKNRDAIGARVELECEGQPGKQFVRTVTAGDAFLAQSTKQVHFGLPKNLKVSGIVVSWPGGASERFPIASSHTRLLLTEGRGEAVVLPVRTPVTLSPDPSKPRATSTAARIVLPGRVLSPSFTFWDCDGAPVSLEARRRLLLFWSSSCPHCVEELTMLTREQSALASVGLEVVLVCLDQLEALSMDDAQGVALSEAAAALVERLELPFHIVQTSAQSMERLTQFRQTLFDMNPDFVVPFAMLLDEQQQVAALYRGAFTAEVFAADLRLLSASLETLRDAAIPCSGSWITKPATEAQFADFVGRRMLSYDLAEGSRYLRAALNAAESPQRRDEFRRRLIDVYTSLHQQAAGRGDDVKASHFAEQLKALEGSR